MKLNKKKYTSRQQWIGFIETLRETSLNVVNDPKLHTEGEGEKERRAQRKPIKKKSFLFTLRRSKSVLRLIFRQAAAFVSHWLGDFVCACGASLLLKQSNECDERRQKMKEKNRPSKPTTHVNKLKSRLIRGYLNFKRKTTARRERKKWDCIRNVRLRRANDDSNITQSNRRESVWLRFNVNSTAAARQLLAQHSRPLLVRRKPTINFNYSSFVIFS